jgi:hypothetical protein
MPKTYTYTQEQQAYVDNYWEAVKFHKPNLTSTTTCFTLNPFAISPAFIHDDGIPVWLTNQRDIDQIKEFKTFPKRGVTWIEIHASAGAYAFKFTGRKPTQKRLLEMAKNDPHEILYRLILDRDGQPITRQKSEEI